MNIESANEMTASIVLAKGNSHKDSFDKKAEVRPINGYDQQSIATLPDNTHQPLKTTELLCRITSFETERSNSGMKRRIDSVENLNKSKEIVRSLTIGDRSALLLCARNATFGDTLHLELKCSYCNKVVSSDVSITSLLIPRNGKSRNTMNVNYRHHNLKIRPITGGDQENLLLQHLYHRNQDKEVNGIIEINSLQEERYSEFLVRSCILRCTPKLPDKRLSSSFVRHVSSKLEELDPLANIVFKMQCPYCNNFIKDFFDVEDFIFRELDLHGRGLYQEVNYLALFYHWTEDAILSLPIMKRKKYVDLIDRTLLDSEETHEKS
jgi:hypothetical protein